MTSKQLIVMWLGILLILAQFYFNNQFKVLFSYIANPSKGSPVTNTPPQKITPQGNPAKGQAPVGAK